MTLDYTNTKLYKTGFNVAKKDAHKDLKQKLEQSLNNSREKIILLTDSISHDLKGLTVHNISHIDKLWEMAAIIAPEWEINPLEAYLLGQAFLFHDAGNSLYAYGGLEELKKSEDWNDFKSLLKARGNSEASDNDIAFTVVRRIHAKKAKELPKAFLLGKKGEQIYFIEDADLRAKCGDKIGLIAQSHGENIDFIEKHLSIPFKLFGFAANLVKIACLLRCSDALHINYDRSPRFLEAIIKPTGLSALHWDFQQRLTEPTNVQDGIVFSVTESFKAEDQDAWWLAFENIVNADKELRNCEQLLKSTGDIGFTAKYMEGAHDPLKLAKSITVEGWIPHDSRIKVTNPSLLAKNLGGAKLYGDDQQVPLRELLQNAMDAVRARRVILGDEEYGEIHVKFDEQGEGENKEFWLSVEDNGVGMSEFVLTQVLLDFGNSLWKSDKILDEFAGLSAKGFESNGRHGIGFFSVFMLGDVVRVYTLKHGEGFDKAIKLEFEKGLDSRPKLSQAFGDEIVRSGGTRIEVKIEKKGKFGFYEILIPYFERQGTHKIEGNNFELNIDYQAQIIRRTAPASDVDIKLSTKENQRRLIIKRDDWLEVSYRDLISRSDYIIPDAKQDLINKLPMEIIKKNGKTVGRGLIYDEGTFFLTEKGLKLKKYGNSNFDDYYVSNLFVGMIFGQHFNIDRNEGLSVLTKKEFNSWSKEYIFNNKNKYNKWTLSRICMRYAIEFDEVLPFTLIPFGKELIDVKKLINMVEKNKIFGATNDVKVQSIYLNQNQPYIFLPHIGVKNLFEMIFKDTLIKLVEVQHDYAGGKGYGYDFKILK